MSRSKISSDPICLDDGLYATVEIERNTKNVEALKNKYHNTREKGNDKYAIFKKEVNLKCKTNGRQICNIVSIECYICYNNQLTVKNELEDTLLYHHPSLGKNYIASKLAFIYKPKKNELKIQAIFFREMAKYFKSLQFDKVCIKELQLVADSFTPIDGQLMVENGITRPDGTKTMIIDISKYFAHSFVEKCETPSKIV
jgi:hypothetical protein